jgi:hypothetical protein
MRVLTLPIALILSLFTYAQSDTSIFMTIRTLEGYDYQFSVPDKWQIFPQTPSMPQLQRLEFTDVALPHVANNAPLTAVCLFRRVAGDSIQVGENFVISEYNSYPDRITPMGYTWTTDTVKIATGEKALLYTTHYYRRSKASNFTRYDLITYSEQRHAAYILGFTYQYKDPTYQIEFDLKLKEYVMRIIRTLRLR